MSDFAVPKLGAQVNAPLPKPTPQVVEQGQGVPATVSGREVFFPTDFTVPSGGGGDFWKPAEHEGSLHIFLGNSGPFDADTQFGLKKAAECRVVVVLDDTNGSVIDIFYNQQVIQTVLAKQLVATPNLVSRLGKGSAGKAGRQAAWVLNDPTPEDLATANSWLAKNAVQKGDDIFLNSELQ